MTRSLHRLAFRRAWLLPVVLVLLIAGHGTVLYFASSHIVLPAALLTGAIVVLVVRHLGLLRPLFERFRRRQRHDAG
jgi:hypothetical protein